jgi:MarR family transcriptional regulator, organic hydroperoxide resistance regulator
MGEAIVDQRAAQKGPDLAAGDELSAAVSRSFIRTLRLHGRLMVRAAGEYGAHPGQAICLRVLRRRDGVTQRELAEHLDISKPTVSRMLGGMERAGLIERETDATDQRLTRVRLTDAGRTLADKLTAASGDVIAATIGKLPASDRAELARLLDAFADRLEQVLAAGPHSIADREEATR